MNNNEIKIFVSRLQKQFKFELLKLFKKHEKKLRHHEIKNREYRKKINGLICLDELYFFGFKDRAFHECLFNIRNHGNIRVDTENSIENLIKNMFRAKSYEHVQVYYEVYKKQLLSIS